MSHPKHTNEPSSCLGRPQKHRRVVTGSKSDLPGLHGLVYFDPALLVSAKEGTFKATSGMKKYLEKHMKRCLSKEEREALYKEHLRPDLASLVPPKVDKYMSEFLGKHLPRELISHTIFLHCVIIRQIYTLFYVRIFFIYAQSSPSGYSILLLTVLHLNTI